MSNNGNLKNELLERYCSDLGKNVLLSRSYNGEGKCECLYAHLCKGAENKCKYKNSAEKTLSYENI